MKQISINIPTFNSEKTLGLCLDAIKKNAYINYEIVIVDGGSTDKTIEIAKSFGAKVCIDDNGYYMQGILGLRIQKENLFWY